MKKYIKEYLGFYWYNTNRLEITEIDDKKILLKLTDESTYENIFNLSKKEKIYLEFANLLTPDNKKQKLNKINKIEAFFSKYGYIYNFDIIQKEPEADNSISSYIVKNFEGKISDVEKEIKILNVIIRLQKILNEGLKIGNTLNFIDNMPLAFARIEEHYEDMNIRNDNLLELLSNLCNKDFFPYKIKDKKSLEFITELLQEYITNNMEFILKEAIPKTIYIENKFYFGLYLKSLLAVMYMELQEDNFKNIFSYCEYCGKLIIDKQKRKYCLMTEEDREYYRTKSKCASNFIMAKRRTPKK